MLFLCFLCAVLLSGCKEDIVQQETKNIDPWTYIRDTSLSNDPIILNFASSAGELGITIGIIGITFSILYMAIRIIMTHDAKKKEEIKQEAGFKGVIGIIIFSIPFWLGVMKTIGDIFVQ